MAKRPVPKYDFKAFGAAIKAARTGRKESRKKVSDEMFISPRYLANIENKGQHPSLQIFFELMLRYNKLGVFFLGHACLDYPAAVRRVVSFSHGKTSFLCVVSSH
ncbi:hypothetical protein I4100191B2_09840 [Clostridiales bacterium]